MRVREVFFHDFRSFRGPRRISFVDPLTDAVRPLTVLAGTNGSGKTTVLDTIEGLLRFLIIDPDSATIDNALHAGLIGMTAEISRSDLPIPDVDRLAKQPNGPDAVPTAVITAVVGQRDKAPADPEARWPNLVGKLLGSAGETTLGQNHLLRLLGGDVVRGMSKGVTPFHGGLLHFPSDRQLGPSVRGPVEPPSEKPEWLFRFTTPKGWQGSLEQLWVWQNYLDLEEGKGERAHLKTFVETVEDILGPDRRITVREGRVRVPVGWKNGSGESPLVSLDQLPSGERHVLLLFGELARRRRPGAIILIDEPELSLHPTMQRLVVHRLRQFAREWDSQVILATHSLEILRAAHESERVILDQLDASPSPLEEEDACVSHD